jgi:hypothetical protein
MSATATAFIKHARAVRPRSLRVVFPRPFRFFAPRPRAHVPALEYSALRSLLRAWSLAIINKSTKCTFCIISALRALKTGFPTRYARKLLGSRARAVRAPLRYKMGILYNCHAPYQMLREYGKPQAVSHTFATRATRAGRAPPPLLYRYIRKRKL